MVSFSKKEWDSIYKYYSIRKEFREACMVLIKKDQSYQDKVYDQLREISLGVIEDFYGDYEPRYYKRQGDLKNAFKINVNPGADWNITYGSEYMKKKHRAENSYIYQLAFMEGYHGGAKKIKNSKVKKWGKHPEPGTPYYRYPPLVAGVEHPYSEWGRPAEKSDSPHNLIEKAATEYINRKFTDYENKLIKPFSKIMNNYAKVSEEVVRILKRKIREGKI